VVTIKAADKEIFEDELQSIAFTQVGTVTKKELIINNEGWKDISYWKDLYDSAIEKYLKGHQSEQALTAL
jgi:phosphoribosylformylglycinamidine synthase subunit PurL